MNKTTVMYGLLCSCLLLAGCKGSGERSVAPVKVKVCKAQVSQIEGGNSYSGTVEETVGSALSFAVGGTVENILVHEGQRVGKGQLIAVLDKNSLERTYEAAEATLEQATDAYNRMKQLHDNNSLPEIQWVDVQIKLRQAQSAERIARKNLDDCRLYAPFAGVIAEKNVEAGQNVMPGMSVVKLVSIDKVKVSIAVPENEMNALRLGEEVTISVSALGDKTFTGVISEKGVTAHSLSRAYNVKISVDNSQGELLPGMICEAGIGGGSGSMAIVVQPNVVSLNNDNRPFVWICDKGKAVRRFVRTGETTAGGVAIIEGLAEGDEVIVEGQQKVSEGMDIVKQ